jgi:uncharacterized membrane protein
LNKPVKSPTPQKNWKQLVLVIVEIIFFLLLWALLLLGIFRGYFVILLIVVSGIMIYISFRNHSEDD